MKTFMEQCGNIFTTQAVIKKWGNSQGIRLSKELMSHMDLKENDTIGINVCGRKMIIELDKRTQTTGVILCDQAKMLDVKARNAQFKEECPEDIWNEAKELIISFM